MIYTPGNEAMICYNYACTIALVLLVNMVVGTRESQLTTEL